MHQWALQYYREGFEPEQTPALNTVGNLGNLIERFLVDRFSRLMLEG